MCVGAIKMLEKLGLMAPGRLTILFISLPSGRGAGAGGRGGIKVSNRRAVGNTCGHTIGTSIARLTSAT
jgi:hypothetical protein